MRRVCGHKRLHRCSMLSRKSLDCSSVIQQLLFFRGCASGLQCLQCGNMFLRHQRVLLANVVQMLQQPLWPMHRLQIADVE